jgi:hypothetical protein
MSAKKKGGSTRAPTTSKKRTRFPTVEAALTDRPTAESEPTEAAAEVTADDASAERTAELQVPDATPAESVTDVAAADDMEVGDGQSGAWVPVEVDTSESAPADDATTSEHVVPVAHLEAVVQIPAAEAVSEVPAAAFPNDLPAAAEAAAEAVAESTPQVATLSESAAQASDAANPEKKARQPRAKPRASVGDGQPRKLSALDAAAKVLGETGRPMGCREMIDAMAARGYWTRPGGKTPDATLYSALLRELNIKGDQARFVKAERGKFGLRPMA